MCDLAKRCLHIMTDAIPYAPNPLPPRRAHAHEPRPPTPDAHGVPGSGICQATASPAPGLNKPGASSGQRSADRGDMVNEDLSLLVPVLSIEVHRFGLRVVSKLHRERREGF